MINHVILMGRLTNNPELRYTSTNNVPVTRFTLAVDRGYKQGEERQADFISCIAWNKTAEFVEKYFSKGKMIIVSGRIQTGSYEKEGKKVYTTDIVAEEVSFGESKGESKPQQEETEGFVPVEMDSELPF